MIIEQASNIEQIKAENPHIVEMVDRSNLDDTIETYNIIEYLGITDEMAYDTDVRKKVDFLIKWAKMSDKPVLSTLIEIDAKTGENGKSTLDKVYQYARIDAEVNRTSEELYFLLEKKKQYETGSISR